jgi:hypothetical protein
LEDLAVSEINNIILNQMHLGKQQREAEGGFCKINKY